MASKNTTHQSSDFMEDVTKAASSRRGFLNQKLIKLHENSTHLDIRASKNRVSPLAIKEAQKFPIRMAPHSNDFQVDDGTIDRTMSKEMSQTKILITGGEPNKDISFETKLL